MDYFVVHILIRWVVGLFFALAGIAAFLLMAFAQGFARADGGDHNSAGDIAWYVGSVLCALFGIALIIFL